MHIDNVIFLILSKIAYTKFSVGPLKVLLQYALLGLNQATGFAGGYDYFVLARTTRDTGKRISF